MPHLASLRPDKSYIHLTSNPGELTSRLLTAESLEMASLRPDKSYIHLTSNPGELTGRLLTAESLAIQTLRVPCWRCSASRLRLPTMEARQASEAKAEGR
jgi:hypothetical protein